MADRGVIQFDDIKLGVCALRFCNLLKLKPSEEEEEETTTATHSGGPFKFFAGNRVIVHSLDKNASYNGMTGVVLDQVTPPDRCVVKFDQAEFGACAVKYANLNHYESKVASLHKALQNAGLVHEDNKPKQKRRHKNKSRGLKKLLKYKVKALKFSKQRRYPAIADF